MASLLEYGWYEWLVHTNFSFLTGASHPHEYVEAAVKYGYQGMAVTDYDGVYGIVRAHRAVKDDAAPVRMFYGAEIHLKQDHHLPLLYQDTLVFIAKSRQGYANLCSLLSKQRHGSKQEPYYTLDELVQAPLEDLAVIVPMRGMIRTASSEMVRHRWLKLKEVFTNNFYVAVTCCLNPAEDVWIDPTYQLAQELGVEILLSQDAYMHHATHKDLSDILQATRVNKNLVDCVEHLFANGERSFHSLEFIEKVYSRFPFYDKALRASRHLADSCCFSLDELRYKYPQELVPDGHTSQSYLEQLTWRGLQTRYPQGVNAEMVKRTEVELKLIGGLNFADYFLTVWDIVAWARSQGILCQGRGSAANSIVCFALGITEIDPSKFRLLFERFLHTERGDPPDIDVDFEHERREEVIQYIYERYGRARAAMVANVICLQVKGAVRCVGRALGLSDEVISEARSYFSILRRKKRGRSMGRGGFSAPTGQMSSKLRSRIETTFESSEELVEDDDAGSESFPHADIFNALGQKWFDLARRLQGFPRHLGIHSGGFIVTDMPLDSLVVQEPATMDGRTVVQWCKEDIEALGFFKIDILALGMLTAIRKCFHLVKRHEAKAYSLYNLPQDDVATYQMMHRADTVGVFQIESRAQMSMLPRLKPRCLYDLVIQVAIIRPGPIQGGLIHPYLKRRDGLEAITYAHPKLADILARTLGIPLFQEQVMEIAMELGNFTAGEASKMRKYMGAWQIKGDLEPWIVKFRTGMAQHGIAQHFIDSLVEQLRAFSHYGFPESHAASFALLAYASSYLKCHHPAAFCAALLNSQPMGFYSPHALIRDLMRHGVEVLPVCVQHSQWDSTLEYRNQRWAVRLGFRLVNSLRVEAAMVLVENRKSGWQSLDHFLHSSGLSRADLGCLAAANALANFGVNRRSALWLFEAARFSPYLEDVDLWHGFAEETASEKIQHDFHALSTTLGEHPTLVLKREAWSYAVAEERLTLAKNLENIASGKIIFVFGMVLVRQAPPSAKGMVFFTLEDETGMINAVFTPPIYEQFADLISRQGFLCLEGQLQRQASAHSILVSKVYEPVKL